MCGGHIEIAEGTTVIECEYCGTQQTIPKNTDENVRALFNRANSLRQKNDFDKAESLYEKILDVDSKEAEAYWGIILCRFGIEYVEDPTTGNMVPTCHRTSFESIVADEYYKKALEYSDFSTRALYEQEAKKIDEIQKGILAISSQEEPYDIFICYKESDASGARTQDSVIANEIYYQLTNEGYKVFYSAITLEDKLGSAYEPVIFAALNSARVMLVIGTKPEYFNAVWVKNEWSRFLKMMKKDRKKMLIPCYKGMDAYELPDEFAHLQSQNMDKIGFINDIIRGIKKVVVKEEKPVAPIIETATVASNAANNNDSVEPLLIRMFMFLEDGDFANAKIYCEKVLDKDPQNPKAYLGALMVDLKVRRREGLANCHQTFDHMGNYAKAVRFSSDQAFVDELKGYNQKIKDRKERERIHGIFMKANTLCNSAAMNQDGINKCEFAIEMLKEFRPDPEAERLTRACREKINQIRAYMENQRLEAEKRRAEEEKRRELLKVKRENATLIRELKAAGEQNVESYLGDINQLKERYQVLRQTASEKFSKINKRFIFPVILNNLLPVVGPTLGFLLLGLLALVLFGALALFGTILGAEGVETVWLALLMLTVMVIIVDVLVAILLMPLSVVLCLLNLPAVLIGIFKPLSVDGYKQFVMVANVILAISVIGGCILGFSLVWLGIVLLLPTICFTVSAIINIIMLKAMKTKLMQYKKYNTSKAEDN